MINSQNFTKTKIDQLVEKFPNAFCRYEHDEFSKIHFIEILPLELYKSSEFCKYESGVLKDFIEHYPHENICFISSDAIVEINDIIYEKSGNNVICEKSGNDVICVFFLDKLIGVADQCKIPSIKARCNYLSQFPIDVTSAWGLDINLSNPYLQSMADIHSIREEGTELINNIKNCSAA